MARLPQVKTSLGFTFSTVSYKCDLQACISVVFISDSLTLGHLTDALKEIEQSPGRLDFTRISVSKSRLSDENESDLPLI